MKRKTQASPLAGAITTIFETLLRDAIAGLDHDELVRELSAGARQLVRAELLGLLGRERSKARAAPATAPAAKGARARAAAAPSKRRGGRKKGAKVHARVYPWKGQKRTLAELAAEHGKPYSLVYQRVAIGKWDLARALTEPAKAAAAEA